MELKWSDLESREKQEKSSRAVSLALEGRWDEAAAVNGEMLSRFPKDVETLNRLGKAYLELGRYAEAREAFRNALDISPYNIIASKNLERLAHLQDTAAPPKVSQKVTPSLFIKESGKSSVIILHRPAPKHVLAKMSAGDRVNLCSQDPRLIVEDLQGDYLGEVQPKLATRLLRLLKGGNQYAGAIASIRQQDVAVALREEYTHPDLSGVCSFPSKGSGESLTYLGESDLPLALETEAEGDGLVPEWGEADGPAGYEERRPPRANQEAAEDEDEEG